MSDVIKELSLLDVPQKQALLAVGIIIGSAEMLCPPAISDEDFYEGIKLSILEGDPMPAEIVDEAQEEFERMEKLFDSVMEVLKERRKKNAN